MANSPSENYRSSKNLANLACVGLLLVLLCDFLHLLAVFGSLLMPDSILDLGEDGTASTWILVIGLIGLLRLPIFIFTVVFFLIWLFRAYKNLVPLRAENAKYTPGWAIGSWFIPIASLFIPFKVVKELWNESDPDFDAETDFLSNSIAGAAPTIMIFWWASWLIYNIAAQLSNRLFNANANIQTVDFSIVFGVASFFGIIAAVLAVLIVRKIAERQELRSERVASFQSTFQTPPSPPTFY
jgi:hypothetical protein